MYLKEIKIENYGSIEKIDYNFPFLDNGDPKPVILMGKNGAGKTLVISNIVHALIELKRKGYREIPETDETSYYRLGTKEYIKNGSEYSYINYNFSNGISFVDLATNNYEKVKSKKLEHIEWNDEGLKSNGYFQKLDLNGMSSKDIPKIFQSNVFIYMPVDRYYSPNWLNNTNPKVKFNSNYESYVGKDTNNMIKNNLLNGVESWILDVIIDRMLYEEKKVIKNIDEGIKQEEIIYTGKNTMIQKVINDFLTEILKLNDSTISSARIGISSKEGRRISILYTKENQEYEYVPKFSNLSSGEIMTLSMIISILQEFDRIYNLKNADINQLAGIVVIDEIDAHLHLDFCRIVLPKMIAMFPKIQFIVTSHSPFFLLGMKEIFNDNCDFVNMPSGFLGDVNNFEEIKKMYELTENNFEKQAQKLKEDEEKIKSTTKPIVITEGKTDWKHIKKAKEKLKNKDEYDFYEFEEDMGDNFALNMLKSQAKIRNSNKRIFIFDNDNNKIINEVSENGKKYKSWGNNVYSFVIPKPNIREKEEKISIEHYYSDEVLKKEVTCKDGIRRRLYFGNDFQTTGINVNLKKRCNKKSVCGKNIIRVLSGEGEEKVFDLDNEDNNSTNYALTKEAFFELIVNDSKNNIDMNNFNLILNIIKEIIEL